MKRAVDLLLATFFLVVTAPLIALAALAVWIEDSGSMLFRQTRVGLHGSDFELLKLRTMITGAEHQGAGYAVDRDDPRITRVGRLLRRHRIDELPQIINILRGEMSWIGPRPEAISLAEWYEREIPFYVYRHIVRPGISGWAQVHQGNVAAVDAAKLKLEYDFYYIKHFSFWLDAIIAMKSVRAIVTCFGSR